MPLIVIHNTHRNDFLDSSRFINGLKRTVAGVSELKIGESDVMISINQGVADGDDQTIVVIVELLFDKPERTFNVRHQLAKSICEYISKYFINKSCKVEVAVKKFNPEKDAFYEE